ncbi:diacylglycerol kinase family protein [Dyadobacter sp. CY312]|uniref:diacylglycerol/lipid kinase family protein n=1 Tax=Dyadobacter sp. CY312 TaxID=2907303 RepID=UPI001F33EEDE|nr:diacylglycerol kinase family protein [Dyadobacter sp. CY312]MCE7038870.1 diacylglycerol kinase [Dyadobacter sp. CY312]
MKKATLLHNPTAGENDFTKTELLDTIKKQGFDVSYASVKKDDWDKFSNDTDFLIIAGGDGTVRRVAKVLMKRERIEKQYPIAILPHGTANNIAGTLKIDGKVKDIVKSWQTATLKRFDIGKVGGLKDQTFFLEAFGLGIFPRLIKVMEKMDDDIGDDVDQKLKVAQAVLYDIVLNYKPQKCKIVADGAEYSGRYIMVEVMNTRSIGPRLELAPNGDPGDGEFDVVLISEEDQQKFGLFLLNQLNEGQETFSFTTIRAKKLEIEWEGKDLHVDDERLKPESPIRVSVEILPGMLEFMVAGD